MVQVKYFADPFRGILGLILSLCYFRAPLVANNKKQLEVAKYTLYYNDIGVIQGNQWQEWIGREDCKPSGAHSDASQFS